MQTDVPSEPLVTSAADDNVSVIDRLGYVPKGTKRHCRSSGFVVVRPSVSSSSASQVKMLQAI